MDTGSSRRDSVCPIPVDWGALDSMLHLEMLIGSRHWTPDEDEEESVRLLDECT
jgi:hypothetical protein